MMEGPPDPSNEPLSIEEVDGGWLVTHNQVAVTLTLEALRETARRLDQALLSRTSPPSSDMR